jgi:hypothetical protein
MRFVTRVTQEEFLPQCTGVSRYDYSQAGNERGSCMNELADEGGAGEKNGHTRRRREIDGKRGVITSLKWLLCWLRMLHTVYTKRLEGAG